MRGCVRHLALLAGYPTCLAATVQLQAAGLLEGCGPRACGVDTGARVRRNISAPGLTLLQKQYLTIAFLAAVRMHNELYGHLLAALRLGAEEDGCRSAVSIAFEPAPTVPGGSSEGGPEPLEAALDVVARASAKAAHGFMDVLGAHS
ncbi:hypothetical protein WJX81_000783 [Elliptochloris bilobata]|uniref:Carboxymuconolactone decarboxylase-like domain-containing protein n=1 Tax=Elliptochloris bilobata TaxID=381761 RepID=A0AAW1QHH6_9CHLO